MGTWKTLKNSDGKGGVRYREHPTRKHGAVPDRYYTLTYWWQSRTVSEKIGWASEGWTPSKCFELMATLKRNQSTGKGPCTMAEMREEGAAEKEAKRRAKEAEAQKDITFKDYTENEYFPVATLNWKDETARKHKEHCKNWLYPKLGKKPLRQITLADLNKVKTAMHSKKDKDGNPRPRSARTQQAVFRTFSMIWESARDHGIVTEKSSTKKASFKLPKVDNERQRFLSFAETDKLLAAVKKRSQQSHDMALLSLHTGMRFSEIARLTWGCVNKAENTILVLNAKGDRSRVVEMGQAVVELFDGMDVGKNGELVFPNQKGGAHTQIPTPFKKAVVDSGLNAGITDPKMRFGFHGLRHTRASWMRKAGADLYTIQRTLGHSTPVMTQRYAHLEQEELREATDAVDRMLEAKDGGGKVIQMQKPVKIGK